MVGINLCDSANFGVFATFFEAAKSLTLPRHSPHVLRPPDRISPHSTDRFATSEERGSITPLHRSLYNLSLSHLAVLSSQDESNTIHAALHPMVDLKGNIASHQGKG